MIHRLRYVFLTIVGLAILAALSGAAYQSIESRAEARRSPEAGRLVDIGGYPLKINCTGNGSPTVILEAGLAMCRSSGAECSRKLRSLRGSVRMTARDTLAAMPGRCRAPVCKSPRNFALCCKMLGKRHPTCSWAILSVATTFECLTELSRHGNRAGGLDARRPVRIVATRMGAKSTLQN